MEPSFSAGDRVVVVKKYLLPFSAGNVIVLQDPRTKQPILKRIQEAKHNRYFVVGDNKKASTDSRIFGWVDKRLILGKVIYPKRV